MENNKRRPRQTNCQNEPPYPDHETVVFCIRAPDTVIHSSSGRCAVEHPHLIADCGEFANPRAIEEDMHEANCNLQALSTPKASVQDGVGDGREELRAAYFDWLKKQALWGRITAEAPEALASAARFLAWDAVKHFAIPKPVATPQKDGELPALDMETGMGWEDRGMAYIRVYQKTHPGMSDIEAACALLDINALQQREDQLAAALEENTRLRSQLCQDDEQMGELVRQVERLTEASNRAVEWLRTVKAGDWGVPTREAITLLTSAPPELKSQSHHMYKEEKECQ